MKSKIKRRRRLLQETKTAISMMLFLFLSTLAMAQQEFTAADKKELILRIERMMDSTYVFPEAATKASKLLKQKEKQGAYEQINSPEEFARALTKDLHSATRDLHFSVKFDPEAIARGKGQGQAVDQAMDYTEQLKMENYGFKEVKILEGNIGYMDLRIFMNPEIAGETAVAAMNFLGNTGAIIFDLRNNGGGSPAMIQLLQSYLYDSEPVHLNNFYFRPTDKHTQTWTLPYVPGKRNPDAEVYVLTSNRSFSAAEEFAYNIRNLERGTLIGETTGGAANPGSTKIIDDRFTIFIPSGRAYSPVTNVNWEGTGVEPHINVPKETALQVAHKKALESLKEKTEDTGMKNFYDWHLQTLQNQEKSVELAKESLASLTGSYGGNKVELKENRLFYDTHGMQLELVPMNERLFFIKDKPDVRLQFSEDKNELTEMFVSGKTRTFSRE